MIGAEYRYNPIEKECLTLVFIIQKMRHYRVGQCIHVIFTVNPLQLLMTRPSSLNYILAKWAILLVQYEMQFMPQKAIKSQAVADFFVDHSVSGSSKIYDDLLNKIAGVNATHAFDGASRTSPEGNIIVCVGVVLIFPHNYVIPRAFSLTEPCSSIVAEYNTFLIGCNLLKRLESKILRHTVIQSSLSTRFMGSMKSNINTWYSITTQPLTWQRSLKTSTLTIYHVSKMRMQMHLHLSLLYWSFQPNP